jgi:hypothetical protein
MKYIFLFFSIFLVFACSYISTNKEKTVIESIDSKKECKLDFFDLMPPKYGLSGDFYTYDTVDISPNKYIFISDLTESAIIKINEVEIHLKIDQVNSKPRENDYFEEVWKGNGIIVILKLRIVKEDDEELYCRGKLEISTKKTIIEFNIHGSSVA